MIFRNIGTFYALIPGRNPTYACIGAIFGMGADMTDSRRSGGNRFFGTIIGGFIGLGLFWMEHLFWLESCYWLKLPLIFLGIAMLIALLVNYVFSRKRVERWFHLKGSKTEDS